MVVEHPSVVLPPCKRKYRVETHRRGPIVGLRVCARGVQSSFPRTRYVLVHCRVSGTTQVCVFLFDPCRRRRRCVWWWWCAGVVCENCIVDASIFYSLYFCVCAHRPLLVVGVRVLCF